MLLCAILVLIGNYSNVQVENKCITLTKIPFLSLGLAELIIYPTGAVGSRIYYLHL